MIELNREQLEDLLNGEEKILLDFYTQTCTACRALTIQIEEVESKSDIPIVQVDAEVFEDIADEYGIMNVPQLVLVQKREEIKRRIGFAPAEVILEFLEEE